MVLIDLTSATALVTEVTDAIFVNLPGILLVITFAVTLRYVVRFFNSAVGNGSLPDPSDRWNKLRGDYDYSMDETMAKMDEEGYDGEVINREYESDDAFIYGDDEAHESMEDRVSKAEYEYDSKHGN